jgi:taurine-pyruvate aminotransferase
VSGGVWTVNVGYGRERIANAVRDQLIKMNYFAAIRGLDPGALFAEKADREDAGHEPGLLHNSGSEANEKAFKMVRQIAHKRYGGKKHKILYRDRDYHGTTIGTMSAGGQDERNAQYGPFTPGFVACRIALNTAPNDQGREGELRRMGRRTRSKEVILREGPDTVGALCLEPVTAGGGVITPPKATGPGAGDLPQIRHPAAHRRGRLRRGPHRHMVRLPALRRRAGHRDHGQGRGLGLCGDRLHGDDRGVFEMFKDDADDPMNYFRDISTFGGCTAGPAAALENMAIIEDEGSCWRTPPPWATTADGQSGRACRTSTP